jgi:hypothetical protein
MYCDTYFIAPIAFSSTQVLVTNQPREKGIHQSLPNQLNMINTWSKWYLVIFYTIIINSLILIN